MVAGKGRKWGEEHEGTGTGWDGLDVGRTEEESKERDISIEEAIVGLARNLALGKFPGIHKDDPS